jgi:hypothetical protein
LWAKAAAEANFYFSQCGAGTSGAGKKLAQKIQIASMFTSKRQ